jgi:hypothetical protein
VLNRLGLQTLVAQLRAGGGTDILAGMRLAGEALRNDPSPLKHIILLTDGGAPEAGLTALAGELKQNFDITTSVIAIGAGAADYLAGMAEAGGGRYHPVDAVETIPSIFTQEAVLASRAYIVEDAFTPTSFQPSPIMTGISEVPPLLGYVATTPRQTAQVALRADPPYYDPILAQWQYGLGRVVAFTSDATGRWAADWLAWDEFPRFWGQAVDWSITESAANQIEAFVTMQGEQAALNVDARTDAGGFLNGLNLNARVLTPDGTAFDIPVRQTAPGRYEGEFAPGTDGAYLVRLFGTDSADAPIQETVGWVMSYSPEYAIGNTASADTLANVAALSAGRDLTGTPAEAFAHTLQAQPAVNPVSFELLVLALLLVPFDVAVRRLLITRSDLGRAWASLTVRRGPAASTDQMQTLKDAKARTRQTLDETTVPSPPPVGPVSAPPPTPSPTAAVSPPAAPPPDSNLAGELLKRRKPKE